MAKKKTEYLITDFTIPSGDTVIVPPRQEFKTITFGFDAMDVEGKLNELREEFYRKGMFIKSFKVIQRTTGFSAVAGGKVVILFEEFKP